MSTIKVTTLQNLSGVEVYTAKSWVSINQTGTQAILASGNISSITDLAVGESKADFANAFPTANFCATLGIAHNMTDAGSGWVETTARTTSAVSFDSEDGNSVQLDRQRIDCALLHNN